MSVSECFICYKTIFIAVQLPPRHLGSATRDSQSSTLVEALLQVCHLDVQNLLHKQLNRESSPVGHLVCVGGCNYTRELEIRSRCTILNAYSQCLWWCCLVINVPPRGEMINKASQLLYFTCWAVSLYRCYFSPFIMQYLQNTQ